VAIERDRGMRPEEPRRIAAADPHHHVGQGDQIAAVGYAHDVAVPRLEHQAKAQTVGLRLAEIGADQIDELVGNGNRKEALGNTLVGHDGGPSGWARSRSNSRRTSEGIGTAQSAARSKATRIAWPE